MYTIIIVMAGGILLGRIFRRRNLSYISKVINLLIWALLFLLGVEVGGNERIVNGIANLGAEALGISIAAVAGSILLAWGLWKWNNSSKTKHNEDRI